MSYSKNVPLAEFLRPDDLKNFFGQKHIVGKNKILFNAIKSDKLQSYLFWGPPGTGKTTLANLIAKSTNSNFIIVNAVDANTKIIKEIFVNAESSLNLENKKTLLFVDEIHRFNKKQQDLFLPYVEKGIIYLISATTENPSFEINSQLLSRMKVLKLNSLDESDIKNILQRAISLKEKWNDRLKDIVVNNEVIEILKYAVNGDARQAINILETLFINALSLSKKIIDESQLKDAMQNVFMNYDKSGEEHYNLISALHKSIRGSDINASIYWFVRMIKSGEDPLYICRRLIRIASEDIGIADTNALTVSLNALNTYKLLGSPEGNLAILEAVIYNASAPKSNSVYTAYNICSEFIDYTGYKPVPLHICNAPTKLMKEMNYNKNYKYPFEYKYNFVDEKYFPDDMDETVFYEPTNFGYEKIIKKRIEFWKKLKKNS